MSERVTAHALLRRLLETTRERELDCDEFQQLLAPWLDGQVEEPALKALIEHHRRQCPECGEETEVLLRALSPDDKA